MKFAGDSVVALLLVLVLCGLSERGHCMREGNFIRMKLGGIRDCKGTHNSAEIDSLARFAIEEHNKKENTLLEFGRVLKAREQVVAGKIYHLTLEAIDAGKKKIYEAKVWVKPWTNFKQLQEFKHAHATSPFTTSDLGVKQDGHKLVWHEVAINDPEVKDAANYAVKSIVAMSNSISPYELVEIVMAEAKVIEDYVKFNLLLKLRRGFKEQWFRVEVNKNLGGKFHVSQLQQESSLIY